MAPAFEIHSVEPAGTWTPEGGTTLNKFSVGVIDPGTGQLVTAQMFYPQDANPPEVGATLNDRILKRSQKGYTLSKDKSAGAGQTPQNAAQEQQIAEQTFGVAPSQTLPAQSAPVANPQVGTAPQNSDPRQESIVRQHSQEMALRALTIQVNAGLIPADTDKETFRASIKGWTEWFQNDAFGREQA